MLAWLVVAVAAAAGTVAAAAVAARRLPAGRRWVIVAVLVAVVIGAGAGPAPTGTTVVDAVLTAAFAAFVVVAASHATSLALLVAAGLVTVGSAAPALPVGAAAIATAFVAARRRQSGDEPSPVLHAVAGALVVTAALDLAWPTRFGASALLAACAVGVIGVSALRGADRDGRRAAAIAAGLLVGLVLLVTAVAIGPIARSRGHVDAAVAAADAGLAAARRGESAEAAQHFDAAAALLREVRDEVERWTALPARGVPVLAQHLVAIDDALTVAEDVATAGSDLAAEVDLERVKPRDGRVDIETLAAFEIPLADAASTLDRAARRLDEIDRESWLSTAVVDRLDDLRESVRRAASDSERALRAARAVPSILGAGGERRWFLAVFTPSELRGGGGLIGNWGILTATDGRIELPVFRRIAELYREEPYRFDVDPEWNARYIERFQLARFPQNILASPHFPSSAEAIRQLADQAGLGPIDGVIAMDPFAMSAFLELTGPITVDGWPESLTPENAVEVLLYRQYLNAEDPNRPAFLASVTRTLFNRLTDGELPSPSTIADTLDSVVEDRHIQLLAFDDAAARYLDEIGADGSLPVPDGDAIGLFGHNAAPSKLDWFLRRRLTYDVEIDPDTGEATATAEVVLRNTATGEDLGSYFGFRRGGYRPGQNRQLVSLYSVLPVASMTVDGEAVQPIRSTERGHHVAETYVVIDPGAEVVIEYRLAGRLANPGSDPDVRTQPAVVPTEIDVDVDVGR